MTNHPNRSKKPGAGENPKPAKVRAARELVQATIGVGITDAQKYCADLVHANIRSWQQWESDGQDKRRMHPAFWELFVAKTKQLLNIEIG